MYTFKQFIDINKKLIINRISVEAWNKAYEEKNKNEIPEKVDLESYLKKNRREVDKLIQDLDRDKDKYLEGHELTQKEKDAIHKICSVIDFQGNLDNGQGINVFKLRKKLYNFVKNGRSIRNETQYGIYRIMDTRN